MNLLMCCAAVGAMILGEWFEAATVTFLFSLALLLEHWSMGRARRAIASLNRPTLFVMEGGYAVDEIGVNAVNVLMGFEDR